MGQPVGVGDHLVHRPGQPPLHVRFHRGNGGADLGLNFLKLRGDAVYIHGVFFHEDKGKPHLLGQGKHGLLLGEGDRVFIQDIAVAVQAETSVEKYVAVKNKVVQEIFLLNLQKVPACGDETADAVVFGQFYGLAGSRADAFFREISQSSVNIKEDGFYHKNSFLLCRNQHTTGGRPCPCLFFARRACFSTRSRTCSRKDSGPRTLITGPKDST